MTEEPKARWSAFRATPARSGHNGRSGPLGTSVGAMTTLHREHPTDEHTHAHGPDCGHTEVEHGDHVDYAHDGHLHREHSGHWDECEPATHTEHGGHEHAHGSDCGHASVPHGDHVDYLHDGHRHAAHDGHYDDH